MKGRGRRGPAMAIFSWHSYNGRLGSEQERTHFLYDTNILRVNWVARLIYCIQEFQYFSVVV